MLMCMQKNDFCTNCLSSLHFTMLNCMHELASSPAAFQICSQPCLGVCKYWLLQYCHLIISTTSNAWAPTPPSHVLNLPSSGSCNDWLIIFPSYQPSTHQSQFPMTDSLPE
ncbi:hypothetical protein O181_001318 [Austropuccinia psidii MF-1]|uniref:Uncharacterized protein n=1 Tax=Austropuccinia psidii MF-1 TaxID=1389203 RepID=A0A9Q3GBL6_9BASI|nr:hypothetical protein [Austropuccinia psidii MF-1]